MNIFNVQKMVNVVKTFVVTAMGKVVKSATITKRNTLFNAAFCMKRAVMVALDRADAVDAQLNALKRRLARTGWVLFGSGHGVSDGKIWCVNGTLKRVLAKLFMSAEEALNYGSILFTDNQHMFHLQDCAGIIPQEVVEKHPKWDGMGEVDAGLLKRLGLKVRQIQVRALWDTHTTMAKGTLMPVWGLEQRTGKSVWFHPSQIKGTVRDSVSGGFLLGICNIAAKRSFRSGWTLTQWLSESVQDKVFQKYGIPILDKLDKIFASNDDALIFLNTVLDYGEDEIEVKSILEGLLLSGMPVLHPWVNHQLAIQAQRAYITTAHGLGLPIHGGMAAYIPNLEDDEISVPWLEDGAVVVVSRYPVRDSRSLKVVTNRRKSWLPKGSIGTNGALGLDDDQDGDYLLVITDQDVIEDIRTLHERHPDRLPRGKSGRKNTPLEHIWSAFQEAIGSSGVGLAANLIGSAVWYKKLSLVPRLSDMLQDSVESLKHDCKLDIAEIVDFAKKNGLPKLDFLTLSKDSKIFLTEAKFSNQNRGLGKFWNIATARFQAVKNAVKHSAQEFTNLFPACEDEGHMETARRLMKLYHAELFKAGKEKDPDLRKQMIHAAVELVRGFGASIREDRRDWACAFWHAAHAKAQPTSKASFGIHGFVPELMEMVREYTKYTPPINIGQMVLKPGAQDVLDVRLVGRNQIVVGALVKDLPHVALKTSAALPTYNIIGGVPHLAKTHGVDRGEALKRFKAFLDGQGEIVDISFSSIAWKGNSRHAAHVGNFRLGMLTHGQFVEDGVLSCRVVYKGNALYATPV